MKTKIAIQNKETGETKYWNAEKKEWNNYNEATIFDDLTKTIQEITKIEQKDELSIKNNFKIIRIP